MTLKIYLAGPDVFLADAREVGRRKCDLCRRHGFEGLFPLDNESADDPDAAAIFAGNCALMRRADIGLVNLSPFRGPSADPGSVFELGFMFALDMTVYGYSSAPHVYADRVETTNGPLQRRDGRLSDSDGYGVEDFQLMDNLMIARAIHDSGGRIVEIEEEGGEPLAAMRAFEACLDAVAQAHGDRTPGGVRATL